VGANEDLQTMLLIGGAILLVVLLMDWLIKIWWNYIYYVIKRDWE
jgi:hypothetical protein